MAGKIDTYFMSMALDLAVKGKGRTSPNPMVGALIVKDRSVVGQGYHQKAGSDHAEIAALKNAGEAADGATLYVTMEPCCHWGKTPPCTEAIIKSGIRRVVAAVIDDNPLVSGKGIRILENAGIETETGILDNSARKLNEAYLKFISGKIPYVTLKLASTLDGKIADSDGKSLWITGPETRKCVHQWRALSDAVLIGAGTVLQDNPQLTVRDAEGPDPLRVVADSNLRTPVESHVYADRNVVVAASDGVNKRKAALFEKHNIEVLKCGTVEGRVSLPRLLKKLGERNIVNLLCEGGTSLATSLLKERLVDKIIITFAPKILGKGISAIGDFGINSLEDVLELRDVETEQIERDVIITGYPEYK